MSRPRGHVQHSARKPDAFGLRTTLKSDLENHFSSLVDGSFCARTGTVLDASENHPGLPRRQPSPGPGRLGASGRKENSFGEPGRGRRMGIGG